MPEFHEISIDADLKNILCNKYVKEYHNLITSNFGRGVLLYRGQRESTLLVLFDDSIPRQPNVKILRHHRYENEKNTTLLRLLV